MFMEKESVVELPEDLVNSIRENYGINIVETNSLYSYYGGVSEITTINGQVFILKLLEDVDDRALLHHEAVVAFCEYIQQNVTEFTTQELVKNKYDKTLQHLEGENYFYIAQKKEIITKKDLTISEQQELGNLMRVFHSKLQDFKHPGIGDAKWMRTFSKEDLELLKEGFAENEYKEYIKDWDYDEMGLQVTLLHGDLHQANMSFTNPPFIFDLDTLSMGSRVEEIARSITHWATRQSKKDFFENIVKGYQILSEDEIKLIPKVMVTICYKKYCEFNLHSDRENANRYKALAGQIKEWFKLP